MPNGLAKSQGVEYLDVHSDAHHRAPHGGRVRRRRSVQKPPGPGVWEPTPPSLTPFFGTWLAELEPFMIDAPTQFRPPAPGLRTQVYTEDFREVKATGRATGSTRTPKQTETALFFLGPHPRPDACRAP